MQSETGAEEHRLRFVNTRYNYSPTAVMGDELAATSDSHLSLSTALLLVICLIIYGVHRHKVKKGHAPYSDWYVIAPHLIVITVSAVMTQFATFSIPNMIAFFIMIALLSALAVRAFRRNNQEETLNMQSEISGKI